MFPDQTQPWDSAPPAPLVSLADMKTLLGVTGATEDTRITFALGVASALIRGSVGRFLSFGTFVETFSPPHRNFDFQQRTTLTLLEFPVKTIEEVTVNEVVSVLPVHLQGTTGQLSLTSVAIGDTLRVTYEAGFDPLPFDLQAVVLELVKKQLGSMNVDLTTVGAPALPSTPVRSVSVGALRVDYALSLTAASARGVEPAVLTSVLEQYEGVLQSYRNSTMLAALA